MTYMGPRATSRVRRPVDAIRRRVSSEERNKNRGGLRVLGARTHRHLEDHLLGGLPGEHVELLNLFVRAKRVSMGREGRMTGQRRFT